jgi:hypothetical protein
MAKTSHGTDLQAKVLADPSGEFGTGSGVTYPAVATSITSGTSVIYPNSNVLLTYNSSGTLQNVGTAGTTIWTPGMSLVGTGIASGSVAGFTYLTSTAASTQQIGSGTVAAGTTYTVTGTGFTSALVGGYFTNGGTGTFVVTGVASSTSLYAYCVSGTTTVSGAITIYYGGPTIVANPSAGVYVLSQYNFANQTTTASYNVLTTSAYITAIAPNVIQDTQKAWLSSTTQSATNPAIGSSNIGVQGSWAGKTVIAGAATRITGTSTISSTAYSVTSTASYTLSPISAPTSSATTAAQLVGGIITLNPNTAGTNTATFVITAYTASATTLTATCIYANGTVPSSPNYEIDYGLYQGTILSNNSQQLIVDSWKSVSQSNSYTLGNNVPVPVPAPTISSGSSYIVVDGGSPSFFMGLSQDGTSVTSYEQYLSSSFSSSNTVTPSSAVSLGSFTINTPLGGTAGTVYNISGSSFTSNLVGSTFTAGATYAVIGYTNSSLLTAICTVTGTPSSGSVAFTAPYRATISAAGFTSDMAGGVLISGTSMWLVTSYVSSTILNLFPLVNANTTASTVYNLSYNATAATTFPAPFSTAGIANTNYGEQISNGLSRGLCTYAHTTGSLGGNTTYTLSKVFTYSGASATAVNKVGIFNASQGGVMMFTTALPAVATLAQSGDTLTVTETVTLS